MASRVAIRVLGAGLGLMLLVGSARAGVSFTADECSFPSMVPDQVMNTILSEGSFDFGDLSQKTCNSIVKRGVSLCKAQVKLATKCNLNALDGVVDIVLKQCEQLANSMDRADCKDSTKLERSQVKDAYKANQTLGLADCEGSFALDLADDCQNGVPK